MTYTVTGGGGCPSVSDTRTVTVNPLPNAGTLSGTQAICVGGTSTFTSSVSDGTWSSGTPAVATINAITGVITGVSAGSATMTYTVTGGNGCIRTVTRTVTVTAPPSAGNLTGGQTICVGSNTTFSSTVSSGNVDQQCSCCGLDQSQFGFGQRCFSRHGHDDLHGHRFGRVL